MQDKDSLEVDSGHSYTTLNVTKPSTRNGYNSTFFFLTCIFHFQGLHSKELKIYLFIFFESMSHYTAPADLEFTT